ncbi:GNAT family N-acetyltransferase [Leuconostoc holzapfelii]|uniref:GNAT family N-acetyltransferase n=1 Tax=Leuconostoc holzapfelii TaxID=434464 RepID=A0A846ZDS6_9LACO|nr:GNAT family N-acetyltransferase [Leuconostoc holzapfelii]NKZ17629.1 GNAT family N-acetyltransferase [Leuconostoc holzapfelii]
MPAVYMRQAQADDLLDIKAIIDSGREYLKQQGLNQWQMGYPNQDTIATDLDLRQGYVLVVDHQVAGYAAVIVGEDPVYGVIEAGQWLNDDKSYVALHRFAMSNQFRGQKLAQRFMTAILSHFYEQNQRDFRIDTHPENLAMQAVITGNGFQKRGNVHIHEGEDRNVRWAYQLVL